jgi:hypothetical protein
MRPCIVHPYCYIPIVTFLFPRVGVLTSQTLSHVRMLLLMFMCEVPVYPFTLRLMPTGCPVLFLTHIAAVPSMPALRAIFEVLGMAQNLAPVFQGLKNVVHWLDVYEHHLMDTLGGFSDKNSSVCAEKCTSVRPCLRCGNREPPPHEGLSTTPVEAGDQVMLPAM